MNGRGTSLALRVLLFALGMVVLVLGLMLLMPAAPAGGPAYMFISIDTLVLYALVFGPLLATDLIGELTGGRIVSMGMYYKALGLYALLTCVLIVCAATVSWLPLGALVVMQLLGLFGLVLAVYFGMVSANHIDDVRLYEAGTRGSLDRLHATSRRLSAQVAHLNTEEAGVSELVCAVESVNEELRYLSPLHTPEAYALEEGIAQCLDALVAATANETLDRAAMEESLANARKASVLIDQRKSMRN